MNTPTYVSGTVQTAAYRALREHVQKALLQYELTPTYWSMLGIIMQARNGIRQVEIAEAMRVKAPLITAMSKELERRGLIQSVQNQFDARAKLLALTPAGKKFVKTVEKTLHESLKQLLIGLTQSDMEAYYKVLTTIISNKESLQKQG